MYNIQRVDPEKWQDNSTLVGYVDELHHHPYCTDSKGYSYIRSKSHAIKHTYIQPNQPARVSYIVLDIDHADGIHTALYDTELPPPHLIIQNPKNAHVHLVYKLFSPVFMWGRAKSAPIRYLARVERGLVRALGADASYGANLMKNPLHKAWRTYTTTAPSEGYALEELAKYVDMNDPIEPANDAGYGRNCSLFDRTKEHGYKYSPKDYNALVAHLTPIAGQYNLAYEVPLFHNEVMHVVRSISRYCSRMDTTASDKAFSKLQSERAICRHGDNTEKKKQAQILAAEGMKIDDIAKQVGLSRRTLERSGLRAKKK